MLWGRTMRTPTLEELQTWFNALHPAERICRVWVRDEATSHICGSEAVGINRMEANRTAQLGLVCDRHKPDNPDWFVGLKNDP